MINWKCRIVTNFELLERKTNTNFTTSVYVDYVESKVMLAH